MIADKLPLVPDRDTLLPLAVRGVAGAWVAGRCAEEDTGNADPWAAPLGAAVAIGVGVAAPKLRRLIGWTTGLPQPVLGLIEDYLALKLGTEAVGLSMGQVSEAARESVEDLRERFRLGDLDRPSASPQSAGAGSM
jgi:hypothetical protein